MLTSRHFPGGGQPLCSNAPPPPVYPAPPPTSSNAVPHKLHIPIQVRNEAVQWLLVRGEPPLLLKATLKAYRQLRTVRDGASPSITDAELLSELLRRTERPDEKPDA